jgi:pilus assembly protein Flp/PilA
MAEPEDGNDAIGATKELEMGSIIRFVNEDQGADLIEYALLAGLISLACIATLTSVGTSITGLFGKITTKINGVVVP